MSEVLSGCAVRAAIQKEVANLKPCRVCGQAPKVHALQGGGMRIGCERDEPELHRCVVESTPSKWAIDTWNALNLAGKDLEPIHVAGPGTPVVGHREKGPR